MAVQVHHQSSECGTHGRSFVCSTHCRTRRKPAFSLFVRGVRVHDQSVEDGVPKLRILNLLPKDEGADKQVWLAAILFGIQCWIVTKDPAAVEPLCIQVEDFGIVIGKRNRSLPTLFPLLLYGFGEEGRGFAQQALVNRILMFALSDDEGDNVGL